MKMQVIQIAYELNGEPKISSVEAELIGSLAIHPTVEEDGRWWTVMHVNTGQTLYQFLELKLEAIIFAKTLATHAGWNGSFEEMKANTELKKHVRAVLKMHGIITYRNFKRNQ